VTDAIRPVDGYEIDDNPGRLNVETVHAYLTRSYWAPGIPRDIVERSIRGSLVWGVYEGTKQVGFARVITDKATFAYLCDVFVLATRDAHGLYEKLGFRRLVRPERHMEIVDPDVYLRGASAKP
jgi:hypothetical protein